MTKRVLILNGPNLNLLERRAKAIYGSSTLLEIENQCQNIAQNLGFDLEFFQSNSESEIVDKIQDAAISQIDAIIINAAAYTHTSIAIRDALEFFPQAKIEIHLSNIYKREEFRQKSMISDVVDGVICGFGANSYYIALNFLA